MNVDEPNETKALEADSKLQHLALIVSNVTKLVGLGVAINEVFIQQHPRTLEILLSVFMMAGAQLTEETVVSMWNKFFGVDEKHK